MKVSSRSRKGEAVVDLILRIRRKYKRKKDPIIFEYQELSDPQIYIYVK
jgi:hypothetical protein